MSGIIWHVFTFSAIGIFLILIVYRVITIVRMPVHLRWELAPVPHEKGKGSYGGSYLEDYEWWRQRRRRSRTAPIIYAMGEIFFLKGVWKNNRTLWPFSFALHTGIYLLIITIILHFVNAILLITVVLESIRNVFQNIASVTALAGDILGIFGVAGLILKRTLELALRNYSTVATYFRLVFLGAVFISGGIAWFSSNNSMAEMGVFVKNLLTLDSSITASVPLAVHVIISLLFIVYLPLTDMVHFMTKYFTYHAVRWNDTPMDEKMQAKLRTMMTQPVGWSAAHVKAGGRKNWADIAAEELGDKEKP